MRSPVILLAILACVAMPLAAGVPDLEAHCLDCHRGGGTTGYQAPVIEGQQHAYLARQLTRFRERHRDNFPMSAVSAGMDDAALDAIATELARRDWPSSRQPPATVARIERGAAVPAAATCSRCHGRDLRGMVDAPRLVGQHRGYLQRQLRAMLAGEREHPRPLDHEPTLHAEEVDDLAAWLHAGALTEAAR
jgi:cytochrome c553